jgi:hypothetical protein
MVLFTFLPFILIKNNFYIVRFRTYELDSDVNLKKSDLCACALRASDFSVMLCAGMQKKTS